MTSFFVLTQRVVVGPFTGVELREAALAGILRHDGIVGGSKDGPWFRACDIGLFAENRTPLPHPPEVEVPLYQVRGMPGAFQGPFKLRELIGFAARGMLPADATVQRVDHDQWIPVERSRILRACLFGDLVLLDRRRKLILRNISLRELDLEEVGDACVPVNFADTVDKTDVTTVASEITNEEWNPAEAAAPYEIVEEETIPAEPSRLSRWVSGLRLPERTRALRLTIPPRIAIQAACLLVAFVGVASAYSYWKQIGVRHDQVIGDWIAMESAGDSETPAFGVSFRADETCVLFNARGESWSGQYSWEPRIEDQPGFQEIAPFTTTFDTVSADHQRGPVEATDGYIRLRGFIDEPMLDGHRVRDLFLRREGKDLQIGYPATVHWTENSRKMEAGWILAKRSGTVRPDIASSLGDLEVRLPVPLEQYGGERPPHISEAIRVVQEGIPTNNGELETVLHESMTYSLTVDAAYMISHYGMPDEARPLHPLEVPQFRNGPSLEDAQVAQYGELRFILSPQGQIRYLELATRRTSSSLFARQ